MTTGATCGVVDAAVALWTAATALRSKLYARGLLPRHRLKARVISVGNITWGGTGKTPFTLWLARALQGRGARISILTRGYRRSGRGATLLLPQSPWETARACGDEAQIYWRHLRAPVGVAARRIQAGELVEASMVVDAHILDDGFQHLALHRDFDIVLIDASNPWGAGHGCTRALRESPSSLARADAIVLTRCELLEGAGGPSALRELKRAVVRYNPRALCLEARTELIGFATPAGDKLSATEMKMRRPLVFCGLGNASAFLDFLALQGVAAAHRLVFRDHHRYTPEDLHQLNQCAAGAGADCFLTTEKDLANLPESAAHDGGLALPLYVTAIDMAVENADLLLTEVARMIRHEGVPRESQPGAISAPLEARR